MTGERDELAALVRAAESGESDRETEQVVQTEPMILFRAASRWYGVHADQVREVVAQDRISRVPAVPAHILGVALVHSRLVPVIDLSAMVGSASVPEAERQRLVVLGSEGAEISVVAEEARGVVEVESPDSASADPGAPFIRGEVHWRDRLVCVLDGDVLVGAATQESEW